VPAQYRALSLCAVRCIVALSVRLLICEWRLYVRETRVRKLQDNLEYIQKKSWCGWRRVDFFDQESFYNLCMPQLPMGRH
jgi:hypothetical protein